MLRSKRIRIDKGFTLIELIIVMSIMGLTLGLVGPFVVEQVERTEAKTEVMRLDALIGKAGYRAFLSGRPMEVLLEGHQAKIRYLDADDDSVAKTVDFDHLFFQPQSLTFNRFGYTQANQISYQLRDSERIIEIVPEMRGIAN